MEVGADGIRGEALGQCLGGRLPREAAAAVSDVEAHAPPTGVVGLGQDPVVLAEDPRARRCEGVGHDVAGPQPGQHGAKVGALGDVGHQRRRGQLGGLERRVQGGLDVVPAGAGPQSDLDAGHDVEVIANDGRRLARARVADVLELTDHGRDQARRGDVDEGDDADRGGVDRVATELAEVREAGGAGIDRGGHAAAQVGRRVESVRAALVPMAVEVDQTGRHQAAPRHPRRGRRPAAERCPMVRAPRSGRPRS